MAEGDNRNFALRVFVLAPTGKDAELTYTILRRAGIDCVVCHDLKEVCDQMTDGVGAVLLAEESVMQERNRCLMEWLERQPAWSDLPILVLARPGADSQVVAQAMDQLGNVTVLESPTRVAALVSAIRTALRARKRQYQIRDHVAEQGLLASIVASSDDAIISLTLEGNILTWNAGAQRLFGYTPAEVIGQPIAKLIPPEREGEESTLLSRLKNGERVEHYETLRVAKDGRRIDVSLSVSPVRDADGRVIAASKVARDITAQKVYEQTLLEADRRKDEFLAMLAHELRNPLAPIRNSIHILRIHIQNDPSIARIGSMMERQVSHMAHLVDDLLDVSRISRGKIELQKDRVDLAVVTQHAIEASRPMIEGLGHKLVIEMPDDPIWLSADSTRVMQIIGNLLSNACKFTPRGGCLFLNVSQDTGSGVIEVQDSGIGIEPAQLSRIFEMFTQLDTSLERSQAGLGIGLTLVKNLVELHGGTIEALSGGAGKGSTFVVRLPLAAEVAPTEPKAASTDKPATSGLQVLIVDDNRDAADSLAMLLQFSGFEAKAVYNGEDAVETAVNEKFDVVLLDLGLPRLNGYDAARQIRARNSNSNLVLVALTGWGQQEDRRRSHEAGFDAHLVKPVELNHLIKLMGDLTEQISASGRQK